MSVESGSADQRAVSRGDVFWIAAAGGIAHPHVVVQDDVFNHSRLRSVIVCALSSNVQRATEPGNVLLDGGEAGLPRRSVVIVSQIDAVDRAALGEWIGRLAGDRVDRILDGLRFRQVSFFAR